MTQIELRDDRPGGIHSPDDIFSPSDMTSVSRVLDPVITMDIVQRYVERERDRNRRMVAWIGALFMLIGLLILVAFALVGIFVLRNARKATSIVDTLEARTDSYAAEVTGISNKVETLEDSHNRIEGTVRSTIEEQRTKELKLKTDLERFSRWVTSTRTEEENALGQLEKRLKELERTSAELASLRKDYESLKSAVKGGTAYTPAVEQTGTGQPPEKVSVTGPAGAEPQAGDSAGAEAGAASADVPEIASSAVRSEPITVENAAEAFAAAEKEAGRVIPAPERPDLKAPGQADITKVTFPSGDRFEGQFKDGLFNGWGIYEYANGDKYEGYFQNDMKQGRGTYVVKDGDRYDGPFSNDMKNGRGRMLLKNGDRYVGEFRDDSITGKGTMLYSNGNKYAGDFRNGLKHGNGILHFFNGDVYQGEFRNDVREGQGTYLFNDGARYVGQFSGGRRHGRGRYVYPTGEEYSGEFKDGEKHGTGVCIYPNGDQLKGQWENDKFVKALEE